MEKTTNLGLSKPAQEDFYNVDDFNTNADILDEQITDIKNGYVKKTGDSMSGDLSFDTNHNIHANSDNGQLVFMGGSEWNKGAGISLWGKDKNGAFTIHSVDENGNMNNLCGWNNGSLTWCDKELATQEHVSDNYLSLNGGTMKGDIELGGNDIYGNWYRIRNNDDNSFIGMSGGGNHSWDTSSTLVLFGNNAGDNAGKAVLNSHGHNLAVCQNGQLLFNNQNIVRSVNGVQADNDGNVTIDSLSGATVVESYTNGTSWYRLWSDGWLEQGGVITTTSAVNNKLVTFLKPFLNANYSLSCNHYADTAYSSSTNNASVDMVADSGETNRHTTTSFYLCRINERVCHHKWYACGQGA